MILAMASGDADELSEIRLTMALPTMAPSAMPARAARWDGLEMPKPTQMGRWERERSGRPFSELWGGGRERARCEERPGEWCRDRTRVCGRTFCWLRGAGDRE